MANKRRVRTPRPAARSAGLFRPMLEALEFRDVPTVFLTQSFDGVPAGTLPTGWTSTNLVTNATDPGWQTSTTLAASPPNSAFIPDVNSISDTVLTSPVFTPTGAAQLTFNNAYSLELEFGPLAYDGAILEISIDGGNTWKEITQAGGTFTSGGYNCTQIDTNYQNPIMMQYDPMNGNVPNWSGTSAGFASGQFTPTTVKLPASSINQPTELRWRVGTDTINTDPTAVAMYIDDVVVQTPAVADLSVTNTDGTNTVVAGGTTTYTVTVSNAGPDAVLGATLNDILPGNISSDTWTAVGTGGATVGTASGIGSITGVTLNIPGGTGQVVFTINATIANLTGVLTTTANVADPIGATDPNTANNSSTDTDTIVPASADLSVTSISNGTTGVSEASDPTYTIVVSNAGPSTATGATLTVSSTPIINPIITYTSWTATYTGGATGPAMGTGAITNLALNLPSGGGATILLTGSIDATATGTLVTTATISPPNGLPDPVAANNKASDTDVVGPPSADLAVTTNTNNATGVVAGVATTYTITVTNFGPSVVVYAPLSNVFAPAADIASASWVMSAATGGATGPASGMGSMTNVPLSMPANSTITFLLTATLTSTATGTVTNTVTVAPPAGTTDPVSGNNSLRDSDPVVSGGDLAVTLTDNATTSAPGAPVTYVMVVSNTGPTTATNAPILGTFSLAVQNVTWSAVVTGGARVGTTSGFGNISDAVTLPAGGQITYTINGTVDPLATGTLTANASIAAPAGFTDPLPTNNTATDTDTLGPTGDVAITVTDNLLKIKGGQADTYTVVVSNTGPSTASNVAVSVPLGALTNVTWTSVVAGGATALAMGTGNITDTVTLPGHSSVTYTVLGTVPLSAFGTLAITGTATTPGTMTKPVTFTDPNLKNNTATDTTGVIEVAGPLYAVGAGPGGGPQVNVYFADTGLLDYSFYAFSPSFHGGVHVAVGDVNGDGQPDIIVGAGAGGGPQVNVFDGLTGKLMRAFYAYSPTFHGGVSVASGDVNDDGYSDIITGAGPGGGPHVEVFSGKDNSMLMQFMAFTTPPTGSKQYANATQYNFGVSVASADVDGDGFADIIVGSGRGYVPEVHVYSGATGQIIANFQAFNPNFLGGVTVAAGDVNGDGKADVVVGQMAGGQPEVAVFSGADFSLIDNFMAFNGGFTGGVTVAVRNLNGSANADIIAGPGPGAPPIVDEFDAAGDNLGSFYGFAPGFLGGVFVG